MFDKKTMFCKQRKRKRILDLLLYPCAFATSCLMGGVCLRQVEAPKSMLTSMPVPSTESIHFHPLTPSSNLPSRLGVENAKFPVGDLPYRFQLDDISTNFARVSLH